MQTPSDRASTAAATVAAAQSALSQIITWRLNGGIAHCSAVAAMIYAEKQLANSLSEAEHSVEVLRAVATPELQQSAGSSGQAEPPANNNLTVHADAALLRCREDLIRLVFVATVYHSQRRDAGEQPFSSTASGCRLLPRVPDAVAACLQGLQPRLYGKVLSEVELKLTAFARILERKTEFLEKAAAATPKQKLNSGLDVVELLLRDLFTADERGAAVPAPAPLSAYGSPVAKSSTNTASGTDMVNFILNIMSGEITVQQSSTMHGAAFATAVEEEEEEEEEEEVETEEPARRRKGKRNTKQHATATTPSSDDQVSERKRTNDIYSSWLRQQLRWSHDFVLASELPPSAPSQRTSTSTSATTCSDSHESSSTGGAAFLPAAVPQTQGVTSSSAPGADGDDETLLLLRLWWRGAGGQALRLHQLVAGTSGAAVHLPLDAVVPPLLAVPREWECEQALQWSPQGAGRVSLSLPLSASLPPPPPPPSALLAAALPPADWLRRAAPTDVGGQTVAGGAGLKRKRLTAAASPPVPTLQLLLSVPVPSAVLASQIL